MTKSEKKTRAIEIQESIRQILFNEWDPIGVNDLMPNDEYDAYIGGLYRLLASGADKEVIAAHLYKLEVDRMDMPTNSQHRDKIAAKLLGLDVSLKN